MKKLLQTFKSFMLDFSNASQIVIDIIDKDLVRIHVPHSISHSALW